MRIPQFCSTCYTERFKQLVQDIGPVDYWRERGWSDDCRRLGEDDYVCE